jgi:DNA-binding SARP family transcriptional activator
MQEIHTEEDQVVTVESRPRILVLGPPAVVVDDRLVSAGGGRARALLAALVLGVNHTVSPDRLIDVVWGDRAPGAATNALQSHVSHLRRLLGPGSIEAHEHGYLLRATCEEIDACVFEHLVEDAAEVQGQDPASARSMVRRALSLWRGEAFGELGPVEPFHLEALRLDELRRTAAEIELVAEVALGERVRAVAQLRAALAADPYRENLWTLLVEALAADGRRAEALAAWDGYAAALAALGLAPSAPMRHLLDQIVGPGACFLRRDQR